MEPKRNSSVPSKVYSVQVEEKRFENLEEANAWTRFFSGSKSSKSVELFRGQTSIARMSHR